IVAHRLGLGEAGEVDPAPPLEAAQEAAVDLDLGQVDAGMLGVADLEQQRLVGQQRRAGCGGGGTADAGRAALRVHAHRASSCSAAPRQSASISISVSVVSSVAASTIRLAQAGLSDSSRLAGTPASTPACASMSTTGAAGTCRRMVISLKKLRL